MKLDKTIDIHYSITKWLSGAVKLLTNLDSGTQTDEACSLRNKIEEWHTYLWTLEVGGLKENLEQEPRNHWITCKKAQQ